MIVPKINDWVACRGFGDGPGKIYTVNGVRQIFLANFLTEPPAEGSFPSSIESSDWLPFSVIEEIISDPVKVAELEKEFG